MTKYFNQRNIQIALTLYALAALLNYGFWHVAAMFERYSAYWQVGYFMASGLEVSVFALSLAIGWRKANKDTKSTFYFWLTLILCLFINVLGNISEGFFIKQGVELTTNNYLDLDIFQIVVALAANLLIPFVTMAQSEILGDFIFQIFKNIVKVEKDAKKKKEAKEKITNFGLPEQERRQSILDHYQLAHASTIKPMTQKQLSGVYDVSLPVIQSDIKILIADGHIKNGRGKINV